MNYCNIIPTIGESNTPSHVFTSVLNLGNIISTEDILSMNIKAKSIRDLATLIFKYSQSANIINKGFPTYEDTGEVKLEYTLKYIIDNPNISNSSAKRIYQKMLDYLKVDIETLYNPTIKYNGTFSRTDLNYSNAVLVQIYNELIEEIPNLRTKSQITLKKLILNRLLEKMSPYRANDNTWEQFVNDYFEDVLKVDSIIWNEFITYLSTEYGIKYYNVQKDLTLSDIEGTFTTDGVEEIWDASSQDKINRKNTIAAIVKNKLAKILNDVNHGDSTVNKLYIPLPMDINSLWNRLINLHIYDKTRGDIVASLERVILQFNDTEKFTDKSNIIGFQKILDEFHKADEGIVDSQNFVNAYISGVALAVIPVNAIALDVDFVASIMTQNRASFAFNVYYDRFISVIQNNLKFGLYDPFNEASERATVITDNGILNIDKTLDSITNAINVIGLDISHRALLSYINSQSDKQGALQEVSNTLNYILKEIDTLKGNRDINYESSTDNRGALYRLANIASLDFDSIGKLSYLDVRGELNYSPQYENLLTSLFRGIAVRGKVREDYLNYRFKDYLNDPTLKFDNLLWYDDATGIGIFEHTKRVDGEGYKLNDSFVDRLAKGEEFIISKFDGIRISEDYSSRGYKYKSIQSTTYKFTEILANLMGQYIFLTSDSPRSYMISVRHIDIDDLYVNEVINIKSKIFTALSKIVDNNLRIFELYGSRVFNIDLNTDEDKDLATSIHNVKYWNGKTIFDKDGIPTGRAFKFLDLTYNDGNGSVNIIKYIANENGVSESDVYKELVKSVVNGVISKYDVSSYIPAFVTKYIQYAENSAESDFGDIAELVSRVSIKLGDTRLSLIEDSRNDAIDELYNDYIKDYKNRHKQEPSFKQKEVLYERSKREVYDTNTEIGKEVYKKAILKIILNNAVYGTSFDGLVYGKLSEYKSTIDYNKRGTQIVKTGLNSIDTGKPIKILVVEDMEFASNIIDKMFVDSTDVTELAIKKSYEKPATINDSMSIITDVRFEDLLKSTGRWDEYKKIVTDLRDETKKFNPLLYDKLIEQLKLFGVARRRRGDFLIKDTAVYDDSGNILSDIFADEVDTVQIKDSTIVLFKSTTRGTAMGDVYDYMIDNDIQQISPKSAVKVSGITPIKIHDDKGRFVAPIVDSRSLLNMKSSDFVIQQDVKPDIIDAEVTVPSRLFKNILGTLSASHYTVDGKSYTPYEFAKEFNTIVSSTIQEDAISVAYELGAIDETGNIRTDNVGNIQLDTRKLTKYFQDVVQDDDSSINIKKALELDSVGQPKMPLSFPVTYRKFERILASKFTKDVIYRKLPGFHAPLRADIFTASNSLISREQYLDKDSYDKAIEDLYERGIITYSRDFIDRCKAEGRSLELRAEYGYDENGELIYKAEVIANPWLKEFFDTIPIIRRVDMGDGVYKEFLSVDIDAIPIEARTMFGGRIPSEGLMSLVVFEIVGFLNTGATQAIFPQSLITRTGWDFDIDTIYAYAKHINFNGESYTIPKYDSKMISEINENLSKYYALKDILKESLEIIKVTKSDTDTSLNSPAFKILTKYFIKLYSSDSNTDVSLDSIIPTLDSILATISNKESIEYKNILRIKTYVQESIPSIVSRVKVNFTNLINTAREYTEAIEYLKYIKQRDLTQEERIALNPGIDNNYIQNKRRMFNELLLSIESDIKTTNKIFNRIESLINSIDITSKDSDNVISINDYYTVKDFFEPFIKGSIKNDNGKVINIFAIFNNIEEKIRRQYNGLKESKGYNFKDISESVTLSRQARDNRIIDMVISILSNKNHRIDIDKPNSFENISAVSARDNALWGKSNNGLNPHNLADKISLNISSMSSTILKGYSINTDGNIAILGNLHAKLNTPVRRIISVDSLPANVTKEVLDSVLGDKNWSYTEDGRYIIVEDVWVGNNASNTFTDLSGERINMQLTEVTAAILDVLKSELMFNLNIDTIGVFRLLSQGCVTELYNGKPNRFSYASAFIMQPAIVELVNFKSGAIITNPNFSILDACNALIIKYTDILNSKYEQKIKYNGHKYRLHTTEELVRFIKNRNNESLNYYLGQLDVLYLFKEYETIANGITDLSFVLKTDVPVNDFNTADERESKLADSYINRDKYFKILKDTYIKSLSYIDSISETEEYWNNYKVLLTDFKSLPTEDFKIKYPNIGYIDTEFITLPDYYAALNDFHNLITWQDRKNKLELLNISYQPTGNITVNGQDIISSVFTGLDENYKFNGIIKPNYKDSLYGIIQVREQYGHWLFANSFNKVFAQRSLAMRKAVRTFLQQNGKSYNRKANNYVTGKVLEYYIQSYGDETVPIMSNIPAKQIKTILGIISDEERAKHNKYINELQNNLGDVITNDKFSKWVSLTLEEQINLILNDKSLKSYINKADFKFSNIFNHLQIVRDSIRRYGYSVIRVVTDDSNKLSVDDVSSGILTMYQSDIPYIAHTIRNLIAYTYITEGFTYGANISKFIPIEILTSDLVNESYQKRITQIGVIDPTIGISDYGQALRTAETKLLNGETFNIEESLDYISRQNPSINATIPSYREQHRINNSTIYQATFGLLVNSEGYNVGKMRVTDANGIERNIIFETKERVIASTRSNAKYLTERLDGNVTIYKRSDSFLYNTTDNSKEVYYYYPVSRLLPNEFSEYSIIDKYNVSDRILIQDENGIISTIDVDTFVKRYSTLKDFLITLDKLESEYKSKTDENTPANFENNSDEGVIIDVPNDYVEEVSYEPEEVSENVPVVPKRKSPLYSLGITFEDTVTEKSNKSLIETVKDEVSKNDNLIYIGHESNIVSRIYDTNGKFIHVDFTKNPYDEANRISKLLKEGDYLIVGDRFEDAGITTETGSIWTKLFIDKLYQNNGNINSINTILNDGFGFAVSQSYVDVNRRNVTYSEPKQLFSKTINIKKPSNIGIETRTKKNSIIALDYYQSLDKLKKFLERNNIPNTAAILDAYSNINKEDYDGSLENDINDANQNAVFYAFERMIPIMENLMDSIRLLLMEVESVNTDTIRNDYAKWQDYKVKVNSLRILIDYLNKFKDIQPITINDTIYNSESEEDVASFHEEFDTANKAIERLSELYNKSISLQSRVLDKVQEIIVDLVITQSRNPNYATAFSKVLEAARKNDFDSSTFDIENLKITSEEYNDIVAKVFALKNSDITFWQSKLDSPFVTGVTLTDIIGKQYTTIKYENNKRINKLLDKVEDAIKELEKAENLNLSTYEARNKYFRKFVNDYGTFINDYNKDAVDEQVQGLKDSIQDLYNRKYYGATYIDERLVDDIIKETDDYILDFNTNSDGILTPLTDEEVDSLLKEIEGKSDVVINNYLKYNGYYEIKRITKIGETPEKVFYKLSYKDSAKNVKYSELTEAELKFLNTIKTIIGNVILEYNPSWFISPDAIIDIFPYLAKPDSKNSLKRFIGVPGIKKDATYEGLDRKTKYILKASTLSIPNFNPIFDIPKRRVGEVYDDYAERVAREFNEWYRKHPDAVEPVAQLKSIADIRDYNAHVKQLNHKEAIDRRTYDIKAVMESFIKELYNIKVVNDFMVDWELGKFALDSAAGEAKIDNLSAIFESMRKRVYNTSKVNNTVDVIAKGIMRYSSINYMWFNWSAGLKNLAKGISDMIIDTSSINYLTSKQLMQGLLDIIKITPEWIAEINKEKTKNPIIALIKDFEVIFQDTRDINVSMTGENWLTKVLTAADTAGYSPNQIGEFFMQFGMLLGMSRSHRVVAGQIMSFQDFYNDSKIEELSKVLTDEQKEEFAKFVKAKDDYIIKYENENKKKYLWQGDYAGEFIRANIDKFTKEQRIELNKLIKDNRKVLKERFEKFPTLDSQLTVVDGRLAYKEGSQLTDKSVNDFKNRVKGVNQALHGIYNIIDKNALQESAFGDLFMQFRKWIRPNFIRYFGRRFNKTQFNEMLGTWEVPVYKPNFDWATYGYKMFKQDSDIVKLNIFKDPRAFFKGLFEMFNYQYKLLRHAKLYYNSLTKGEQASVIKWAKHLSTIAVIAVAAMMLGKLKDDDEPYYYTVTMYTLTALYKEVVEPVPLYGWYSTINQMKDKLFVGETVITNAMNVVKYAMADVFTDDESLVYDRGVYKGQTKLSVSVKKLIPILTQIEKSKNLKATMNWYKWYNPFNL